MNQDIARLHRMKIRYDNQEFVFVVAATTEEHARLKVAEYMFTIGISHTEFGVMGCELIPSGVLDITHEQAATGKAVTP